MLTLIALAISLPAALSAVGPFTGYKAFRVFVYREGVYATAALIVLLILCSFIAYAA